MITILIILSLGDIISKKLKRPKFRMGLIKFKTRKDWIENR